MCVSSLSALEHQFLKAFWQTMIREWVGIDRLRLDKFYMVRQCGTKAGDPQALGQYTKPGLVCNILGCRAARAWSAPILRASKNSKQEPVEDTSYPNHKFPDLKAESQANAVRW